MNTNASERFRGQTIDDRYQVVGTAEGGMAYVLFCHDLRSGQMVALKMQKEGVGSADLFLSEAKTWVSLGAHPHIVQALYASRLGPMAYIVLEMVPPTTSRGCSLRNWLDERFPFDPELGLRWIVQICDAMEYAVARGALIHRDIKPENILITPRYDAKLSDFGLAASRMGSGLPGGTPRYMAPEQRFGRSDTRSDIYALGLVMVELFLGPGWELDEMDAETLRREFARQVRHPLPWLSEIAEIAARCLQPIADQRYATFSDLKRDLDDLARRYLGHPAAQMLARATSSAMQLTNQGLAFLNLGLPDEGIRLLQRAAARSSGDGIAITRLRHELQTLYLGGRRSPRVLVRYVLNQLRENCATAPWWFRFALFAALLAAAFAISPASSYAKVCAALIGALLLMETMVNEYTLLTLFAFQRAMLGLCVFLYGLSWVMLPAADHVSWPEQLFGWAIGAIVPFGFYPAANWVGRRSGLGTISTGPVRFFVPLVLVLGSRTWLLLAVYHIVLGLLAIVGHVTQRLRYRWLQQQGVYMAAELASLRESVVPTSLSLLIAVGLTFLFGGLMTK